MKRPLLIIALCLLLGAVVNVAVAWGASVMLQPFLNVARHLPGEDREAALSLWQEYVGVAPVPDEIAGVRYDELYVSVTLTLLHRRSTGTPSYRLAYVFVQSGWPSRSMEGSMRMPRRGPPVLSYVLRSGGLLPLRPIWPGFAINTLFYATILWLWIYSLSALSRFLRVRRGLCPKCAYPMGESAICSECGITLPRRRRMPKLT